MKEHQDLLKSICRVCSRKITLKHGYKTSKSVDEYNNTLFRFYNIDIDLEPVNIYPKNLCSGCKRKLDRLTKKLNNDPELSEKFEAGSFVCHSDESCLFCIKHLTERTENTLNLRNFDKMMTSHGFQIQNNDSFKRVFSSAKIESEILYNEIVFFLHHDYRWYIQVNQKTFKQSSLTILNELPVIINDENMNLFDVFFATIKVCEGLHGFSDVIKSRFNYEELFVSRDGSTLGIVEDNLHNELNRNKFTIFRGTHCSYLTNDGSNVCQSCRSNSNYLRTCQSRLSQASMEPAKKKLRTSDTSTTNPRYLSREELIERLRNAQNQKRDAIKRVSRLTKVIQKEIEMEGVTLSKRQNDEFNNILINNTPQFEENSPAWLLWQQQKEVLEKKDSRGMRWHPLMIRWCLSIYYTSAAAYKQLTSSKLSFLKLPHINTLKKYGNFTTPSTGFNPDILKELVTEAKLSTAKNFERNVTICFDEMRIKSNLVYSKSTGKLIGFTEMGEINEEFRSFQDKVEQKCESGKEIERDFASYVLVYMVRGIFSKLCYPFAYFASTGFTAAQLYPCTLEATKVLSSLGFCVRAYVCDGASPNRKFFKLMAAGAEDDFYWTWNPVEKRKKIYFFSDTPHLLKTTRNCLENSFWNKNTRNMHVSISYFFICFLQ